MRNTLKHWYDSGKYLCRLSAVGSVPSKADLAGKDSNCAICYASFSSPIKVRAWLLTSIMILIFSWHVVIYFAKIALQHGWIRNIRVRCVVRKWCKRIIIGNVVRQHGCRNCSRERESYYDDRGLIRLYLEWSQLYIYMIACCRQRLVRDERMKYSLIFIIRSQLSQCPIDHSITRSRSDYWAEWCEKRKWVMRIVCSPLWIESDYRLKRYEVRHNSCIDYWISIWRYLGDGCAVLIAAFVEADWY